MIKFSRMREPGTERKGREVVAVIPGWQRTGSAPQAYAFGLDAIVAHTPGRAAYIEATTDAPNGFGALSQSIRAGAFAGQRVRLTAAVRAERLAGCAILWMHVSDRHGRALVSDNMENRPVRDTAEWARHAVVLDVPADAGQIAFGLLLDGAGTVWFDDLALERVGLDVPVTQVPRGDSLAFQGADVYDIGEDEAPDKPGAKSTAFIRSRGGASAHRFGALCREVPALPHRGKRVRLSGWVEPTNVASRAGLWLKIRSASWSKVGFDEPEDRPICGTGPWARHEIVLDVPTGAEVIAYGAALLGTGELRLADLALEEVSASVPVTRSPNPAAPPSSQMVPEDYEVEGDMEAPRGRGATIRAKVAEPRGFRSMGKGVDATPYRRTKVRLTALLKADEVCGAGKLWMRVDGVDEQVLLLADLGERALRGTLDWARYGIVLGGPREAATRLALGAWLSGAGRLEVAELALELADPSAQVTSAPWEAPRNFGFEE